jgi:hypothetical protein
MRPFVARSLLVGASIVLVAVGALALSGSSRVVVLVAASCCAVLDVLVVRSGGSARSAADAVVPGPAPLDAPDPGVGHPRTVVLGRGQDGRPVELDVVGRRTHVVVVGAGVLAHAVFRALAVQLYARAHDDDLVTRSAAAAGLTDLVAGPTPGDDAHRPRLPDGTAAIAADPSGPSPFTLVLVPGAGLLPRRWDVVVEVTRYGCSCRRSGESRSARITPALPQFGGDGPRVVG